jgi:hypothetical protein
VGLEQLHGQVPDDAQLLRDPQRQPLRRQRQLRRQPGRGRDHRVADAVHLHRLHHRIRHGLPVRGTHHVRRELAGEVHRLLGEHRHPGPERLRRLGAARGLGGAHQPHALAVVPAPDRLQDHGEAARAARLRREARHVRRVGDDAVAGAGHAELSKPGPHHALVLGVHQRVGAGPHGYALGLKGTQVLRRHVLVVEGDHVAAVGEVTQRVQVPVVADDDVARHPGGGVLRAVAQHPETDAERDACLVGHAGELPAADHANYRERHETQRSGRVRQRRRKPAPRRNQRPPPDVPIDGSRVAAVPTRVLRGSV